MPIFESPPLYFTEFGAFIQRLSAQVLSFELEQTGTTVITYAPRDGRRAVQVDLVIDDNTQRYPFVLSTLSDGQTAPLRYFATSPGSSMNHTLRWFPSTPEYANNFGEVVSGWSYVIDGIFETIVDDWTDGTYDSAVTDQIESITGVMGVAIRVHRCFTDHEPIHFSHRLSAYNTEAPTDLFQSIIDAAPSTTGAVHIFGGLSPQGDRALQDIARRDVDITITPESVRYRQFPPED